MRMWNHLEERPFMPLARLSTLREDDHRRTQNVASVGSKFAGDRSLLFFFFLVEKLLCDFNCPLLLHLQSIS